MLGHYAVCVTLNHRPNSRHEIECGFPTSNMHELLANSNLHFIRIQPTFASCVVTPAWDKKGSEGEPAGTAAVWIADAFLSQFVSPMTRKRAPELVLCRSSGNLLCVGRDRISFPRYTINSESSMRNMYQEHLQPNPFGRRSSRRRHCARLALVRTRRLCKRFR